MNCNGFLHNKKLHYAPEQLHLYIAKDLMPFHVPQNTNGLNRFYVGEQRWHFFCYCIFEMSNIVIIRKLEFGIVVKK